MDDLDLHHYQLHYNGYHLSYNLPVLVLWLLVAGNFHLVQLVTEGFELLVEIGTQVRENVWIHFGMLVIHTAGLNHARAMEGTSQKIWQSFVEATQ